MGAVTTALDAAPLYEVIAIACSAGGLAALAAVLGGLAPGFRASIPVVQHLDRHHRSLIAEILDRRSHLSVKQAEDGEALRPGLVYIAPPDRHLLVHRRGTIELTQSALVHFVGPSADLLFELVAAAFGPRAIAVVLTSSGRDGATGAISVKARGGPAPGQRRFSSPRRTAAANRSGAGSSRPR